MEDLLHQLCHSGDDCDVTLLAIDKEARIRLAKEAVQLMIGTMS